MRELIRKKQVNWWGMDKTSSVAMLCKPLCSLGGFNVNTQMPKRGLQFVLLFSKNLSHLTWRMTLYRLCSRSPVRAIRLARALQGSRVTITTWAKNIRLVMICWSSNFQCIKTLALLEMFRKRTCSATEGGDNSRTRRKRQPEYIRQ